jgi:hypothetical protein
MGDDDIPIRRLGTEVFFEDGDAVIEGFLVDQYRLNASGTTTYLSCDGRRTVARIIEHVAHTYGIEPDACAEDVRAFISRLHAADLVTAALRS